MIDLTESSGVKEGVLKYAPCNNSNNSGGIGGNRKKEWKRKRMSWKITSKYDGEDESHGSRAAATAASASGRPVAVSSELPIRRKRLQ